MRRLVELAEDVGATYRLTRLITTDELTAGARERLVENRRAVLHSEGDVVETAHRWGGDIAEHGGPLAYLVQCPWCASVYVGLGVAVARRLFPLPWGLVARGLSMSAITGWLSERS